VLEQEPKNLIALFGKAYNAQEFKAGGGVDEICRCYSKLFFGFTPTTPPPTLTMTYSTRKRGNPYRLSSTMRLHSASINPNHATAHYNYGSLLSTQGKLVQAAEHFKAARKIKPNCCVQHPLQLRYPAYSYSRGSS